MPAKLIVGKLNSNLEQFSEEWTRYRLENRQDVLDFLNAVTSLVDERPLLLYDLSLLGKDMSLLRVFLETTERNVVCLASFDNIPENLLSRFAVFEKHSFFYTTGEPEAGAVIEFLSSDEEKTVSDTLKTFIAFDPRFFHYHNLFSGNPAYTKILRLFTK